MTQEIRLFTLPRRMAPPSKNQNPFNLFTRIKAWRCFRSETRKYFKNPFFRCVQVLISSDVKFQSKNAAGKTPREMAQDNNQPVILGKPSRKFEAEINHLMP